MQTLARESRKTLENAVKKARKIAEAGARKVIERLGVGDAKAPGGLSADEQQLRIRLRAHGRQLGDQRDPKAGTQTIMRLVAECAYEHWHRMLFARFLAETELLIEPEHGVPISLADCEELAREGGQDWLALASAYAQRMLPQIFRAGDPVLEVALPPETRSELEDVLKKLSRDVFLADDSLGWVYQFWQADQKEAINKSEVKIGADELPAVTQLFTEDYMVLFLLHNTLGAWWAGKVLAARPELAPSANSEDELRAACAVGDIEWSYLRFVREENGSWRPAAGTFGGWPKAAREITVLDPCMGSGHFLVFALPILVAIRMAEESLTREAAVDAALRENLFGLELDPRCTQIAAFNLALAAWRMVGYRRLPALQLACSGLSLGVSKSEWLKLAEKASSIPPKKDLFGKQENLFSDRMRSGLEQLYDLFEKGPWLGSLINPRAEDASLTVAGFQELEPLVKLLLASRDTSELSELAVTAQGLSKAAELLSRRFTLVATNVPYLKSGKQREGLREFSAAFANDASGDLATTFTERCLQLCSAGGTTAVVTPQNWLFLKGYTELRQRWFQSISWALIARLGSRAFQTPMYDFNIMLGVFVNRVPNEAATCLALDAANYLDALSKAQALRSDNIEKIVQSDQLHHPDARLVLGKMASVPLLSTTALALSGLSAGDSVRFERCYWEVREKGEDWEFLQGTVSQHGVYGGRSSIVFWQQEKGEMFQLAESVRHLNHAAQNWLRGKPSWGKQGVIVSQMGSLQCTLYLGDRYDCNCCAIIPHEPGWIPALWTFCSSNEFHDGVRQIDQAIKVTPHTLLKVPFDLAHWQRIAVEKYPDGLPRPQSDDATQWLFSGHPRGAEQPLQVAVARLLGYHWPRQTGSTFPDCPALGPDALEHHADGDGIVCLTSVKGEASATDRLYKLLSDAFGPDWSASQLDTLLRDVGFAGKSLDVWLRDGFFENHCEVFHNRPFIWHLWDGREDGFHALVNYHKLSGDDGRRTLEKLIYTYLGDWITRQRREQQTGIDGAEARLAAALHLQAELEKILHGEPPYDIFVRWKPLHEQPIGWESDINDGVRLNIRPFMTARPLGARAKNACILRVTPKNIKWDSDRGKEPHRDKADFPWFWSWDEQSPDFAGRGDQPDGKRWNGLHYTNAVKQAARDRKRGQ